MSDAQGLLAAICDQPEEDAPRLIYADWLEEHAVSEADRARAEFIRLQCEAARLPPEDDDIDSAERRTRLELRADDLRQNDEVWRRWLVPVTDLPPELSFAPMSRGFVRGFPHFALASPDQFLTLGERLFRVNPVHMLWSGVSDEHRLTPDRADRLLAAPWLRRVRRLEMTLEGCSAERLLRAENLIGLEELTVRHAWFLSPGSPADGEAIGSLRELHLWGVGEGSMLPRLAELLSGDSLTALGSSVPRSAPVEMCRQLATLAPFRGLQRLTLAGPGHGHPLPGEALRQLMAAPFWPNLRRLNFGDWGFGDEAAEVLAEAGPAPNLRTLGLSVHSMTHRGVAALAMSPVLRTVTSLDLGCGNGVGDDGVALLAHSPYLRNLAELNLPVGRPGPKGIQAIADAPWAATLVRMDLRDNAIRKAGVELLADPKRFPRLLRLGLQRAVRTSKLQAVLTARFGSGVRFRF
jgi:uncharacterized protein (TIGR02996 family)